MQERIIESRHLLDGHWILGQGTIYPDTIESGGTAKAAVIKTHHNRVAGIQKLIDGRPDRGAAELVLQGRGARDRPRAWASPRAAGPASVSRAWAWRSGACARGPNRRSAGDAEGYIMPVHSVGVQGDSAATRPCWRFRRSITAERPSSSTGLPGINRHSRRKWRGESPFRTWRFGRVRCRPDGSAACGAPMRWSAACPRQAASTARFGNFRWC